jgi:hypothetical protein
VIAFDFKTYRRGAETQRKRREEQNPEKNLIFSASSLRPLRLREAWPRATALGVFKFDCPETFTTQQGIDYENLLFAG